MRASTMQADLLKLEACTCDVKSWLAVNDLLLNADKSEVMMIGTSSQLRLAATFSTVTVANSRLTVASQLKSLGVIFDPRLTFDAHVSSVCRRAITTYGHYDTFGEYCHKTLLRHLHPCLLYTSPSPRDRQKSRMPSSA